MDIFEKDRDERSAAPRARPLADRLRPHILDDFIGQEKIVGPGTPLRRAIEAGRVGSIIFWGPPGSGKTTLASIIATSCKGEFLKYSAVTSTIKELKTVIAGARKRRKMYGTITYLFIDEIHRFDHPHRRHHGKSVFRSHHPAFVPRARVCARTPDQRSYQDHD